MQRIVLAFLLAVAVLPAQPKKRADDRVKFDTDLARVLVVTNTPGQKSRPHKHDVNRVMVYLTDGAQRLKYDDGTVKDQNWKAGDVFWDPAGGMHTSENTSGKPFRIVEIELKRPGAPVTFSKLDPVKVDPSHYKVMLENDQVRVVRVRFADGDAVPLHEHGLPRVVVFLTNYNMRAVTPDGQTTEMKGSAGDVILGGVAKHSEKNRGGFTEIIAVEMKSKP